MEQELKLFLPAAEVKSLEKLLERASKNIEGIKWEITEPYNKIFRHVVDGKIEKWQHTIVDACITIPAVNDWVLLATIVEGNMVVTNPKEKLVFNKIEHGVDYKICDSCGRPQWKKSFIVRNINTNEELQIGSECAKKFGIGTVNAIYNLTKELYASYNFCGSEYDGLEPIEWPAHYSDYGAVKSVETNIMLQAARKYYVENNGVWKKGYYERGLYYASESAAIIRQTLSSFSVKEDDYINEVIEWVKNVFDPDEWNDFDCSIKSIGENYYMSAGDVAMAFFAIKKYEAYKKREKFNKEKEECRKRGIYLPEKGDYVHIMGKIVNKTKVNGYFGEFTEYEILNEIDGVLYKRAGVVRHDENNNVNVFAYIKDVWNDNYILDRTTIKPKKGVKIDNEF